LKQTIKILPQKLKSAVWRKRVLIPLLALILLAVLALLAFDTRLRVVRYTVPSGKISAPVRIALITDLHSCRYGEGQRNLIRAIDDQKPDIIVYVGDIFDDGLPNDNTITLLSALRGRYPAYYVIGNHEYWSLEFAEMCDIMRENGVTVLEGEWETIELRGQKLNICGVDDPDVDRFDKTTVRFAKQLEYVKAASENGEYTILLSHRPELADEYAGDAFDLVLAGHAHGGQWRIPGLVNGLFAPNQGKFPKYAGGRYEIDDTGTVMIVSRGLARETTRIPRVFNRPELVIVDLTAE
jgi:predicted MPP superfamily phosphohydrolase